MAKKATTIILFVVVLLLLASTVYVSIILTSEEAPALTTNTRASELDSDLDAADPLADPFVDPLADPFAAGDESDPFAETEDGVETANQGTDPADPSLDPSVDPINPSNDPTLDPASMDEELLSDTRVPQDGLQEDGTGDAATEDGDSLAYLNQPPIDEPLDTTEQTDVFEEEMTTTELPESGLGQATPTTTPSPLPSPTFAPTMGVTSAPQAVEPTQTIALPTAGFGIGIVTAVVAGLTIVASILL